MDQSTDIFVEPGACGVQCLSVSGECQAKYV